MPPEEPRSIPSATPKIPGRIVEGFRAAIADPKQRPKAYVRLTVSGGVHGESYDFEYRIDAAGRISSHLMDEMKQRRYSTPADSARKASSERFVDVARKLDVEALARIEKPTAGFPPDSVVGRLEINDGEQSAAFVFLADDQQAASARYTAPDALRKAVDVLYREAAAHLGADDLKP